MRPYLRNGFFQVGVVLAVLGCGPLLAIIAIDAIGLWPDPNPNPVGPGMLFLATVWPAIICLVIGVWRVRRGIPASERSDGNTWERIAHSVPGRFLAGGVGGILFVRGAFDMLVLKQVTRGSVAAVLVGIAALHWAMTARIPGWMRR